MSDVDFSWKLTQPFLKHFRTCLTETDSSSNKVSLYCFRTIDDQLPSDLISLYFKNADSFFSKYNCLLGSGITGRIPSRRAFCSRRTRYSWSKWGINFSTNHVLSHCTMGISRNSREMGHSRDDDRRPLGRILSMEINRSHTQDAQW